MKNPVILVLILLSTALVSCIGNRYSYKRSGEEVHLRFNHVNESSWPEHVELQSVFASAGDSKTRGIGAAVALPFLFRVSYNQVEKSLQHEGRKRTAQYFATGSDDWFFLNTQPQSPVNLKNIILYRLISTRHAETDTAVVMQIGLQRSWDGLFLRFVVERLRINYTKAKLAFNDNRLDMDVLIDLSTFAVERESDVERDKINPFTITIYNIPIGKEMSAEALKDYSSPWFPMPPRSYIDENKYGTGNFSMLVKVTEFAEYGEQVISVDEKVNLGDHRSDVNNLIDEIIRLKQKSE